MKIKNLFSKNIHNQPNFGFLFDIDGVIARGKDVLPCAVESFKRLIAIDKKFRIPTVFVTNSGNVLRNEKAADLSRWLGINVNEDQVILSYSPLCKFKEYHNKRILMSGQGNIQKIASELGFNNILTMKKLVKNFPSLDYVDKRKRTSINGPVNNKFERIDGIILLNEPTNWETSLQLIIDLLLTDGLPHKAHTLFPYPHLFIIACNMDLLWVSEAPLPRYGHGAFLVCLETLYKKITGKELIYRVMTGKPSLTTYCYANSMITKHAASIGIHRKIDTIYAIGDNINTDIYGANAYNEYIKEIRYSNDLRHFDLIQSDIKYRESMSQTCVSILVETGVHNSTSDFFDHHSHRDFPPINRNLFKPSYISKDVSDAIDLALNLECFQ